jgi:hypothetical protein
MGLAGVQVAAQETAHGPTPDRMSAIALHIIGQRRYIKLGLSRLRLSLQTPLPAIACRHQCRA